MHTRRSKSARRTERCLCRATRRRSVRATHSIIFRSRLVARHGYYLPAARADGAAARWNAPRTPSPRRFPARALQSERAYGGLFNRAVRDRVAFRQHCSRAFNQKRKPFSPSCRPYRDIGEKSPAVAGLVSFFYACLPLSLRERSSRISIGRVSVAGFLPGGQLSKVCSCSVAVSSPRHANNNHGYLCRPPRGGHTHCRRQCPVARRCTW